jgi:NAD(P)H-dependent FMN reductase/ketosteroid isomerase-like protein
MSGSFSVAVIVGSLRRESFSRKMAHALMAQAPKSLTCGIVEIGDLPLYNQDLDDKPPANWEKFRAGIRKADAVLFVTPEYNRSIPGCLKNATDIGSRPQGKNVFDGMPAGIVSVTPYKLGAFGANHALRQSFVYLNLLPMQQPEAYIGNAGEMFDESGKLKNDDTAKILKTFMNALASWIETVRAGAGADKNGFGEFLEKRDEIARDYVNGDAASLGKVVAQHDPATFFSPGGDIDQGAAKVAASYKKGAKMFSGPGKSKLEILQSHAGGDLAFWTGLQRAEVRMGPKGEKTPMTLRITEVFRFEDGGWKLAHRHADMKDASKASKAA